MPHNQILCTIDKDGNIKDIQNNEFIGIDKQKEQELLDEISTLTQKLDEWKPCMIEAGYIEPDPPTAEEIMKQQSEAIKILTQTVNQLTQQVEKLNRPVRDSSGKFIKQEDKNGLVSIDSGLIDE